MKRLSKKAVVVLVVLYSATWVGGLIVYPRDMTRRAKEEHSLALSSQRKSAAQTEEMKKIVEAHPAAFPDGPKTAFRWCIPVAPAVLLVSSDYYIGPLWGHGGIRLVLFYGIGTIETPPFIGWIS